MYTLTWPDSVHLLFAAFSLLMCQQSECITHLNHVPGNHYSQCGTIHACFRRLLNRLSLAQCVTNAGVWEAINVLDAAYSNNSEFQPRTLSIVVQDKPGVLNEVCRLALLLLILLCACGSCLCLFTPVAITK